MNNESSWSIMTHTIYCSTGLDLSLNAYHLKIVSTKRDLFSKIDLPKSFHLSLGLSREDNKSQVF